MPIKALMVDVDGVIVVQADPGGWSIHLERDLGLSEKALKDAFFAPHFSDVVCGRAGLRERLAPVLAEIAPHLSVDLLVNYWFTHDAHFDQDLLGQLAEFRALGLKLHLVTVQEHERADYLWRVLQLNNRFDAIHYAADIGWAKPAQEFFAEVERRTGFEPSEMFFIDDKLDNVQAARARGWNAALWTGNQRLEDVLRDEAPAAPEAVP